MTLLTSLSGLSKENPKSIYNEIEEAIEYPSTDKEGIVALSVYVDQDGSLEVTGINASDPELSSHVINELEEVRLSNTDARIGQEFFYKIQFERR